jgi:ABC-type transport system substrate-binding protein
MTAPRLLAVAFAALVALSCNNSPYAADDARENVLYRVFSESPRRLDPAEAYDVIAHRVTGLVHDRLLEYHYLKRPFTLIPGLALEVPSAEPLPNGGVAYRFRMRRGAGFGEDVCFELSGGPGARTREATTDDIAFQLKRLADPALEVQVRESFLNVRGFGEFMAELTERRKDPAFAALPVKQQYDRIGPMAGVRTPTPFELEIELREPYPQILYWFALEFTSPVAWEAVQYYDGKDGRPLFREHVPGTGPFRIVQYDKQAKIVLARNEHWWGLRATDPASAPAAFYPSEGEPGDAAAGLLDPRFVGRRVPFVDRIELRRDKEAIPAFYKFLQGYYDYAEIIRESFNQVIVSNTQVSPDMQAKGVALSTTISPSWFYLGFNLEDKVVGYPNGERARKLRQAMGLAIDRQQWLDTMLNGRGRLAEAIVPPGVFGYDAARKNPLSGPDLPRARKLLAEAGYPDGIDPATGKPLRLTYDTYARNTQEVLKDQFFVNEWRKLGLDVQLSTTTYNEFQNKIRRLAYQIIFFGWSADYPDPENFLMLRTCALRRSTNGGPNTANFCNERYDALFERMRVRENDAERLAIIEEMLGILEHERPHIDLYHQAEYFLVHDWVSNVKQFGMSNPMVKYYAVDPALRAERRVAWNQPVRWPAYVLGLALALGALPAFRTFFRERQ